MTTWRESKEARPLTGRAKVAHDEERRRMGVGYLILQARAAAELSQSQLAVKIGTSQPTVARWESGVQVPSVRSLLRIAEATGFEFEVALRRGAKLGPRLTLAPA
jgi:transcriptional regulator with XRE-family HTH domain